MAAAKKKKKVVFECTACGKQAVGWFGKCPGCGEFNLAVEVIEASDVKPSHAIARPNAGKNIAHLLSDVEAAEYPRIIIDIEEFNRVLGGGIVPGSITLVGGEPGQGKSTILTQVTALLAQQSVVLYSSGEESEQQTKMRTDRMGITAPNLYILAENDLDTILQQANELKPVLLVVDSIQTVYASDIDSAAGSVSQVRECASRLQALAKSTGIAVILVGHVTKDGTIAGPRVLEHLVDAVLYLEGDQFQSFRLLRGIKNRFGATNEVGVFEMTEEGLMEVTNPSEAFLSDRNLQASGSSIAVTMEGTRPLLVEVQALVAQSPFSSPRRSVNGTDLNRLNTIAVVLSKHGKLKLFDKDIITNVIGGLKITEPAADLALVAAIVSSYFNVIFPADIAVFGEIGLSGECRAVNQFPARLNEAAKIGVKRILAPIPVRGLPDDLPIEVIPVKNVGDLIAFIKELITPEEKKKRKEQRDRNTQRKRAALAN